MSHKTNDIFNWLHSSKTCINRAGENEMSEKRLNNTIFLMYLVTENYKKARNLTNEDFLRLDEKYAILNYISECPDIFDSMTGTEMTQEIDQYVSAV